MADQTEEELKQAQAEAKAAVESIPLIEEPAKAPEVPKIKEPIKEAKAETPTIEPVSNPDIEMAKIQEAPHAGMAVITPTKTERQLEQSQDRIKELRAQRETEADFTKARKEQFKLEHPYIAKAGMAATQTVHAIANEPIFGKDKIKHDIEAEKLKSAELNNALKMQRLRNVQSKNRPKLSLPQVNTAGLFSAAGASQQRAPTQPKASRKKGAVQEVVVQPPPAPIFVENSYENMASKVGGNYGYDTTPVLKNLGGTSVQPDQTGGDQTLAKIGSARPLQQLQG